MLLGLVTWSIDLMNFIVDELFNLSSLIKAEGTVNRDFLQAKSASFIPYLLLDRSD